MPTGYDELLYIEKLKQEIVALKKIVSKYKRLSHKNPLTGLWNRRKLNEDIKRYRELHKRFGIKFLLIVLDLDNFKKLNDKYGHEAGDKHLKKVARVLKNNIRKYENAYHLGGDEFVLILSHYNRKELLFKRLKKKLLKENIKASIGICELGNNCLKIADTEMYKDKKKGK